MFAVGDHAICLYQRNNYHVIVEKLLSTGGAVVQEYGTPVHFTTPLANLLEFSIENLQMHKLPPKKYSKMFLTKVLNGTAYQTCGREVVFYENKTLPIEEADLLAEKTKSEKRVPSSQSRRAEPLSANSFFLKEGERIFTPTRLSDDTFALPSLKHEVQISMRKLQYDKKKRETVIVSDGSMYGFSGSSHCNNQTCLLLDWTTARPILEGQTQLVQNVVDDPAQLSDNLMDVFHPDLLRILVYQEYKLVALGQVVRLPLPRDKTVNALLQDCDDGTVGITTTKRTLRLCYEGLLRRVMNEMLADGRLFYPNELRLHLLKSDLGAIASGDIFDFFGGDHLLRVLAMVPLYVKALNADTNYVLGHTLLLLDSLSEALHLFAADAEYV